ncbi:MAG TPA: hypothetical protein VNQ55_03590, partial [Parapedobacter sp.]|nr:hypothetical protein [Parapedobacter sp.]
MIIAFQKHLLLALVAVTVVASACQHQSAKTAGTLQLSREFINEQLDDAEAQIKILTDSVPADRMPRTFQGDTSVFSNTGWWTSGFYPGSLLYLYEYSGDERLLQLAKDKLRILEKE